MLEGYRGVHTVIGSKRLESKRKQEDRKLLKEIKWIQERLRKNYGSGGNRVVRLMRENHIYSMEPFFIIKRAHKHVYI